MKKFFAALLSGFMICALSVNAAARAAPDTVSESVVLMDAATGQVLYEKNGYTRQYPASITKIMTGLLVLENGTLDDTVTVSDTALDYEYNASNIALARGEEISVESLMYGMAIESANDAANALAEYVSGSQTEFARLMTQRAKELGCLDTNFVNANGLHDDNHYTTAYDMALIARECIKHEEFNTIFNTETFTVGATNKQVERVFNSANWFINGAYEYDGILMSKIGWTEEATHTMVTACKRDGMTLICVVMKSTEKKSKWDDTAAMFDWAFDTFIPVTVSGEKIALSADETIPCNESGTLYVNREDITADDVTILVTNANDADGIVITYGRPTLSDDMQTAYLTATLSLGDTEITTVDAAAPVSEKAGAADTSAVTTAETSKVSDIITSIIFSVLTFVAVMIVDILVNKRI